MKQAYQIPTVWNAATYERLSKEDKKKRDESNSIKNQRALLMDFASRHPDINVVHDLADDGYTGANFDRDAFKEMISYIEDGTINCVIVKDFSRLGREHIETGKLLERYFAAKKVRFISVNDGYDSLISDMTDRNNSLIIPFKNILSEATLEDISIKTKSQLAIKRKSGELVSNYTVFGYVKEGKRLVVDDYAGEVVDFIFNSKIDGKNESQIAAELNATGVPSPSEYKKVLGIPYYTPFTSGDKGFWSANAVKRILINRIYVGCLEQGKRTKTSYRMTKFYYKPREEWVIHNDNHEPIIDIWTFETVQELMAMDTRVTAGASVINIFSGFVVCGFCGRPMIVKTTKKESGASYANYICSTHKKYGTCQNNNVSVKAIEKIALLTVQSHVDMLLNVDELFNGMDETELKTRKQTAINGMIERNLQAVRDNRDLLVKSFEHMVGGVITEDEHHIFKAAFNNKITEAENNISMLRKELETLADDRRVLEHIERFKQYGNINELNRRIVVTLLKSIIVNENKDISINLRYTSEIDDNTQTALGKVVA
jgi:DNA invertase Pin-like site-specific DNA recombinase